MELLRECPFPGHSPGLWLFDSSNNKYIVVLVEGILSPRGILWKKGMALCAFVRAWLQILALTSLIASNFCYVFCDPGTFPRFFFFQKKKCVYLSCSMLCALSSSHLHFEKIFLLQAATPFEQVHLCYVLSSQSRSFPYSLCFFKKNYLPRVLSVWRQSCTSSTSSLSEIVMLA